MEYVELDGFTICLYKCYLLFACNILYVIAKNTLVMNELDIDFISCKLQMQTFKVNSFLHLPWFDFTSIPSIFSEFYFLMHTQKFSTIQRRLLLVSLHSSGFVEGIGTGNRRLKIRGWKL